MAKQCSSITAAINERAMSLTGICFSGRFLSVCFSGSRPHCAKSVICKDFPKFAYTQCTASPFRRKSAQTCLNWIINKCTKRNMVAKSLKTNDRRKRSNSSLIESLNVKLRGLVPLHYCHAHSLPFKFGTIVLCALCT